MERGVYEVESQIEKNHWWFVCRRELFAREISRLGLKPDARILDIGTSTGTNLRMLHDIGFTNFIGVDQSQDAADFCQSKGLGRVTIGDVCDLPYPDGHFELVLATDIVEHVDQDDLAVKEIYRVLKPGGRILMTVPAFNCLWGLQDDNSHHKRRYHLHDFTGLLTSAGFVVERAYYFNFLLFLPIWIARRLIRVFKVKLKSENEIGGSKLNWLLKKIFRLDCLLAPSLRIPFGVSLLTIARR